MLFQFVSQEFMLHSIAYTSFNLSENLYNPSRVAVIAKQMTWSGTVEAFKTNLANEKPRKNTGTYLHRFIANSSPLKIEWLENVGRLYPIGVRPIFEEHVAVCFWGRVLTPKKTTHYSMRMAPLTSCREKVLSLCIGIGHLKNQPVYKPIWVLLNPSTIIHQPLRYMTSAFTCFSQSDQQ